MKKHSNPIGELVIDLPDKNKKGEWIKENADRLEQAIIVLEKCDSVAVKIANMKSQAIRNIYTLEVYEQVNTVFTEPLQNYISELIIFIRTFSR